MKYANWKVPQGAAVIPEELQTAGYSPLLAAILHLRGLSTKKEAEEFLSGGEEQLSDPLRLEDMTTAVQRLTRAIALKEHVAVYGDYDVDGITAGCLLSDYLRGRGLQCELRIPDRIEEGYGLNNDAIDELKAMGVSLIITVDCGVTNLEEAAYAGSVGVDMIITDHHECREELPNADAVVDPKRQNNLEGVNLAGVGVAFKLVCALDGDANRMLEKYGDLVAVGTVADVMPILGENRYIVKYGLKKISEKKCRPGLLALLEQAGVSDKKLTASTIGYSLAPRINAAGRLGVTHLAVDLLEATDLRKAEDLAFELCRKNRERQEKEKEIWERAKTKLKGTHPTAPIVLADEGWHPGVIGIVASRLTDAYSVPAVMICLDGEMGKGSCRSIGNFNLYEALESCSDCLEGFGGHAMAAGVTVRKDRIDEFREKLAEYYLAHPEHSVPALEPDLAVDRPEFLSEQSVESLDYLEPCGNANPRPLLYMAEARLTKLTPIGAGKHLRLCFEKFNCAYDSVFFSQTSQNLGVRIGETADLVFAPQINDFRGQRSVQLVITDIRPHRS